MDVETLNLLEIAKQVRDELDSRYDGSPDSDTRWMGYYINRLDTSIGPVVAKMYKILSLLKREEKRQPAPAGGEEGP